MAVAAPNPPIPPMRPAPPPPRRDIFTGLQSFWERVTEGMALEQLWSQFKAEARTTYRFYSRDLPAAGEQAKRGANVRAVASAFFWSVMNKLSPARRVLLLVGLVLLVFPSFKVGANADETSAVPADTLHIVGGIMILALLLLEIADRVTMKRDLQIAREIQLWLVPQNPPAVAGLDIAFRNRPANTVAGDYYDVFGRDGHYLFTVADVAGKSLPAALLMATFQASLKTLSARPGTLAELVAGLNTYACAHSRGGERFTTAFIAEYDPGSGGLVYVNAGHNAPVLLRADGRIDRLDRGGLPLGILPDTHYDCGAALLESGDTLLIFTDGLIEAANISDQEYGEERMLACMQAQRGRTADELVRQLMMSVDVFVGAAPQHDDTTCVVAKKI